MGATVAFAGTCVPEDVSFNTEADGVVNGFLRKISEWTRLFFSLKNSKALAYGIP